MNQTKLACCGLVVSACLLAALLVVNLQKHDVSFVQKAQAELVVNAGGFTFLTTRTQPNEEALWVLDKGNNRLLIYTLNLARKRLELVGSEDLARVLELKVGGAARVPGGPGRIGR